MRDVLVVNGPNLNLLGVRRPEVYGKVTLPQLEELCRRWGAELGLAVHTFQSNHEGELIDRLHAARGEAEGVVFNPGALTHSSYALHDAVEAIEIPTIEVHISNVEEREEWRRVSVIRPACARTIYGRGIWGYRWALRHLVNRAAHPFETLAYGSDPEQVGDLRRPEGEGPHPVVALVHGGFWRHAWERDTFESVAVELARQGVATWNVEYRRTGKGGGPEASADDVKRAVRHLAGIRDLDTSRLALVGHSAGSQLALTTAPAVRPRMVASLAGVTDMLRALAEGLGSGSVAAFLAGSPAEQCSPIHRLPIGVPLLVAHGEDDRRVPVSYAREFAAAADEAGDEVELAVTEGGGHYDYLDPDAPACKLVMEWVLDRLG